MWYAVVCGDRTASRLRRDSTGAVHARETPEGSMFSALIAKTSIEIRSYFESKKCTMQRDAYGDWKLKIEHLVSSALSLARFSLRRHRGHSHWACKSGPCASDGRLSRCRQSLGTSATLRYIRFQILVEDEKTKNTKTPLSQI